MHTACRLSPTPGKWFLVGISDSEAGYRRQGIRHFYVTQEDSVKDLPGKGLTDIGSSVGKGKGKEKGKQPQELDPPVPQYEPQEQEQAAQQYIQPTSQYFAVPQHVPDYRQDQLPYPQWSQQVAAFAFPPQEQMWECAPWLAGGYPLAEDANHNDLRPWWQYRQD